MMLPSLFVLLIKAADGQSMFHTEKVKNMYFPLLMSPRWLWHVHWLCAFSSTGQTGLRSPSLNPRRVFKVNRFTLYCSILLCRLCQRHRRNFISTSIISPFMTQFSCAVLPTLPPSCHNPLFLFFIFCIQLNNYFPDIYCFVFDFSWST